MKKLFNLITENFSVTDYKQFKADLSETYQELFDRKLKPSTLDNFASRVLGANNPNILSSALVENEHTFNDGLSLEQCLNLAVSKLHSSRNGLTPIMEIVAMVDGAQVELTVCVEAYAVDDVSEILFRLFLHSDDDGAKIGTGIRDIVDEGGVYLSEHITMKGGFGAFLSDNGVDLSQTVIRSMPACKMLGYAEIENRSFDSFSEYWLTDLLSAFANKVNGELNSIGGWYCSFYEYQEDSSYQKYMSYVK